MASSARERRQKGEQGGVQLGGVFEVGNVAHAFENDEFTTDKTAGEVLTLRQGGNIVQLAPDYEYGWLEAGVVCIIFKSGLRGIYHEISGEPVADRLRRTSHA